MTSSERGGLPGPRSRPNAQSWHRKCWATIAHSLMTRAHVVHPAENQKVIHVDVIQFRSSPRMARRRGRRKRLLGYLTKLSVSP